VLVLGKAKPERASSALSGFCYYFRHCGLDPQSHKAGGMMGSRVKPTMTRRCSATARLLRFPGLPSQRRILAA